jgi:hypothetical protein
MVKYLLGALIGIFIFLAIYFSYRKIFLVERFDYSHYKNSSVLAFPPKTALNDSLSTDYKIVLSNLEEKNSSINKRVDDLLIFGGIIITLLLAINIAVYVNAESIVEKHLKENYEKYNQKIKSFADQAEIEFIKLRTQVDLITGLKEKLEITQEIIHDNNDSDRKPKA